MIARLIARLGRRWRALLLLALLGGYWLLPISGQVVILPGPAAPAGLWPQMRLDPPAPAAGQPVRVLLTDVAPWAYVLLTVDGRPVRLDGSRADPGGTWTWQWTLPDRPAPGSVLAFYHDCERGCVERGRFAVGPAGLAAPPPGAPAPGPPTRLGLVFASPERDWHGRSGWVVELTYAHLPEEPYWGVDDLAARVSAAAAKGLRVLVRVDYDRGQSLPPTGHELALVEYLRYLERLARDDRLRDVYGYVIGSGYNARDASAQAPDRPVTPEWYARLFNGAGQPPARRDNAVQAIRAANPRARVLVGPVRPWVTDQEGARRHPSGAPWLSYFDTLVALLDEGARAKATAGVALAAPDGFALQVPGRPAAAERIGRSAADEPRLDLPHPTYPDAQAGFRVYRDWLAIVNAHPTTRGLPAYVTSTNTFAPDEGTPPAQNYPRGWLTAALEEVSAEPQVQALCWFLDGPLGDRQWDWFSLARPGGRLLDAAEEFDALLRGQGAGDG